MSLSVAAGEISHATIKGLGLSYGDEFEFFGWGDEPLAAPVPAHVETWERGCYIVLIGENDDEQRIHPQAKFWGRNPAETAGGSRVLAVREAECGK